jgi:hypothetical protein
MSPLDKPRAVDQTHRLVSREPSLNDVFLHLYGAQPDTERDNGAAE